MKSRNPVAASSMDHDTSEDTFKTVTYFENQAQYNSDSFKTVQNYAEAHGNRFRTDATDSDTYKTTQVEQVQQIEEKQHIASAGFWKSKRWLIIICCIGTSIIILVAVLGGVLGTKHSRKAAHSSGTGQSSSVGNESAPHSANDTLSAKLPFPGTAIATVNNGSSPLTELFYQTGSGRIHRLLCNLSSDGKQQNNCSKPLDLNITDAKLPSPLTSVGIPANHSHLFYVDKSNTLRSVLVNKSSAQIDESFNTFTQTSNIQLHNSTHLSAIRFPFALPTESPEIVRLYYQDSSGDVMELLYSESEGPQWTRGAMIGAAAPGAKLVSLAWENWSDPTHLLQVRVYFENTEDQFVENVWGSNTTFSWGPGLAPRRTLNDLAGLAGVVWSDQPTALGQVILYTTDPSTALYEFGIRGPADWTAIDEEDPNQMNAFMQNTTYPIAAVNWLDKNTTQEALVTTQVFFQATEDAGGFEQVVTHDGGDVLI